MRRELLEPVEHKENLGRTLEMEERKKNSREREYKFLSYMLCSSPTNVLFKRKQRQRVSKSKDIARCNWKTRV